MVNGPEVLSKYVGQAEENIRNLFGEAEAEYRERGDESVSEQERREPLLGLLIASLSMCIRACFPAVSSAS